MNIGHTQLSGPQNTPVRLSSGRPASNVPPDITSQFNHGTDQVYFSASPAHIQQQVETQLIAYEELLKDISENHIARVFVLKDASEGPVTVFRLKDSDQIYEYRSNSEDGFLLAKNQITPLQGGKVGLFSGKRESVLFMEPQSPDSRNTDLRFRQASNKANIASDNEDWKNRFIALLEKLDFAAMCAPQVNSLDAL